MFQNAVMVLVLVPVYFKNERNETIARLLQKCIMKSGHPLQMKQRCKTRLRLRLRQRPRLRLSPVKNSVFVVRSCPQLGYILTLLHPAIFTTAQFKQRQSMTTLTTADMHTFQIFTCQIRIHDYTYNSRFWSVRPCQGARPRPLSCRTWSGLAKVQRSVLQAACNM